MVFVSFNWQIHYLKLSNVILLKLFCFIMRVKSINTVPNLFCHVVVTIKIIMVFKRITDGIR